MGAAQVPYVEAYHGLWLWSVSFAIAVGIVLASCELLGIVYICSQGGLHSDPHGGLLFMVIV